MKKALSKEGVFFIFSTEKIGVYDFDILRIFCVQKVKKISKANRTNWKSGKPKGDQLDNVRQPRRAHLYEVKYSALYFTWKLCRKNLKTTTRRKTF